VAFGLSNLNPFCWDFTANMCTARQTRNNLKSRRKQVQVTNKATFAHLKYTEFLCPVPCCSLMLMIVVLMRWPVNTLLFFTAHVKYNRTLQKRAKICKNFANLTKVFKNKFAKVFELQVFCDIPLFHFTCVDCFSTTPKYQSRGLGERLHQMRRSFGVEEVRRRIARAAAAAT